MVFPVVMYRCESWTIKKAKCQRIDAFELWCWRRLLRVSWTARRSNQSILKEINPEYSLKGLMLVQLKVQYFGLIGRANSLEKTLILGKMEGMRRRGGQRMRWSDGIIDLMDMSLSKLWEIGKDREACHTAVHRVANSWTWLSDWTTTKPKSPTGWIKRKCTWYQQMIPGQRLQKVVSSQGSLLELSFQWSLDSPKLIYWTPLFSNNKGTFFND